jgi:three-Cys-motif partner protein
MFDEVGYWSEIKLEIIRRYATEYTKILRAQGRFKFFYVDGFASSGMHFSKSQGQLIPGSPLIALDVEPPFDQHFLVELNPEKHNALSRLISQHPRGDRSRLFLGDCNEVLLKSVFPEISYSRYERALCLLDPYGLDLNWEVVREAGRSGAIEVFLNFPVMDMNRNALWHEPERVADGMRRRMTRYWGDETWRSAAYAPEPDLFGSRERKVTNETIAETFRKRLKEVAAFEFVPKPIPLRNNNGATVYYLFFASSNATADRIVRHIFDAFRNRGAR